MAFTASNYRLYQSYISPYISVDISRHLKGQLIALWQACARPLKEKAGQGGATPPLQAFKLIHIQTHANTPPCPYLSRPSFCLFHHFIPFLYSPRGSSPLLCHHTCHFNEHRSTKLIFVYMLFVFMCMALLMKVNRYHSLKSLRRKMRLNECVL